MKVVKVTFCRYTAEIDPHSTMQVPRQEEKGLTAGCVQSILRLPGRKSVQQHKEDIYEELDVDDYLGVVERNEVLPNPGHDGLRCHNTSL